MHKGSCLCRSIQYELSAELGDFGYCHCKSCRKASGSAHAANAPIDRTHFHFIGSSETLREYESSPGKFRAFCSRCGSPIYAYVATTRDVLRLRLGQPGYAVPQAGQGAYLRGRQGDVGPIEGPLPQFPAWAPKSVLDQRGTLQHEV